MPESITKVGMREFRAHLPQYLKAVVPMAITRHGETVGYYIPAKPAPQQAERDVLKVAAARLEKLLMVHNINEDGLVTEFRQQRHPAAR